MSLLLGVPGLFAQQQRYYEKNENDQLLKYQLDR